MSPCLCRCQDRQIDPAHHQWQRAAPEPSRGADLVFDFCAGRHTQGCHCQVQRQDRRDHQERRQASEMLRAAVAKGARSRLTCGAWRRTGGCRCHPARFDEEEWLMQAYICTACGTQYPPRETPPPLCSICADERQFVPTTGQGWTTLEKLRVSHFNAYREHEPNLIG